MRTIRFSALIGAVAMAGTLNVAVVTPVKAATSAVRPTVTGTTGCNVSPVRGVRNVRCAVPVV